MIEPEAVQQASSAAVATIWQQAQELANESLRSAQAAWEAERAELDAMRQELAEAFERQAGELDAATAALAAEKAAAEVEAARAELVKVQAKAEAAEQAHAEQRKQAATEAHRAAGRAEAEEIPAGTQRVICPAHGDSFTTWPSCRRHQTVTQAKDAGLPAMPCRSIPQIRSIFPRCSCPRWARIHGKLRLFAHVGD